MMAKPALEVCYNLEWIKNNALDVSDVPEDEQETAAFSYGERVLGELRESGWQVEYSSGYQRTYHGWNGARFSKRLGIVATYGKLTKEQVREIEAIQQKAREVTLDIYADC
jgi:hypothetical protein